MGPGRLDESSTGTRSITLRCGPAAPAAGRRFAQRVAVIGELRDTIELLISELVTNAVIHARSDVELTISEHGARIRVEVSDTNPQMPAIREPDAASGRGLRLVDALADRWGTIGRADGKTVWFETSTQSENTSSARS